MELIRKVIAQTTEGTTVEEAWQIIKSLEKYLKEAEERQETIHMITELTIIPNITTEL